MLTPPQIDGGDSITLELPELRPATVTVTDAHPAGKWVIFKACGFEAEEAAQRAGKQFGDTLLVTGALAKLGVDVGFSRTTQQFSKEIHEAARRKSGRELRAETHGLMTYEENTTQILGMDARGSTTISRDTLEDHLKNWQFVAGILAERQRNCASLLNDSFFVSNTEGQFILRISAVEALCDQSDVSSAYQAVIQAMGDHVATFSMDADIRETVRRMLANASRESLHQSYMSKFRKHRTEADAKAFDRLYQKRSKLVHDGLGRGELSQASDEALQLAVDLLGAELRSTSASP